MGFFDWQERKIRKISERNMGFAVLGESLIAISFGGLYWIQLVRYGFFIYIAATLLATYYIISTFLHWHRNEALNYQTILLGYLGGFLLLFFFGIQSPQLPLKKYILIAGLLLVVPASRDLIRRGGNKV
jgi:Na+/proline symporter